MMSMKNSPHFGILLALLGALTITPDTLFMRLSQMDLWTMTAWRGMEMGFILLSLWAISGLLNPVRWVADLRILVQPASFAIMFCIFAGGVSFTFAISETSVAIVLFSIACAPLFSALFSRLILKERTRPITYFTMLVCLFGIALAVFSSNADNVGPGGSVLIGAFFGLITAAALGMSFVLLRAHPAIPLLPANGCAALFAGFFGLICLGDQSLFSGSVAMISVSGLFILPFSFLALTAATRYTSAANVSLLMLLETVLGPIWVWLGTGERPGPTMILGGFIVVISLGVYLIVESKKVSKEN